MASDELDPKLRAALERATRAFDAVEDIGDKLNQTFRSAGVAGRTAAVRAQDARREAGPATAQQIQAAADRAVARARTAWTQTVRPFENIQTGIGDVRRGVEQFQREAPIWFQRYTATQGRRSAPTYVGGTAVGGLVLPGQSQQRGGSLIVPGQQRGGGSLIVPSGGYTGGAVVNQTNTLRQAWHQATLNGIRDALKTGLAAGGVGGGGRGGGPPTMFGAPGGGDDADREKRRLDDLRRADEAVVQARRQSVLANDAWRRGIEQNALAVDSLSNRMRANGVLSQEFITAAVRGEASWREWGYQIGNVTAKFGAWAVAGSAVYAGFDAIRRVGTGAIQSAGVEGGLSRSIDNLDTDQAKAAIRDLSREFNVTFAEAEQAVETQSRKFGDLTSSVEAAKTALYGVKVGDLGVEDASQYTTAIANGLGIGRDNAKELQVVFDQINEAQNRFGISIKDTMQGLGTAAGTWTNAGGDRTDLLALISTIEKTTGRSGKEAGTAAQRMISFLSRPSNQEKLSEFGVAIGGSVSDTLESAFEVAEDLIKQGRRGEVNKLAEALADPQIGSRIAPALANRQLFEDIRRGTSPEAAEGSAQRELDKQLSRFSEQLQKVLNNLERLGSNLEQSGLLNAIGGLVLGINGLLDVTNGLLSAFNTLPGPVRSIVSSLVALELGLAALRRFNTAGVGANGPLSGIISRSGVDLSKQRIDQTLRLSLDAVEKEMVATSRRAQQAGIRAGAAVRSQGEITQAMGAVPRGSAEYRNLEEQLAVQKQIETQELRRESSAKNRIGILRQEAQHYDDQLKAVKQIKTEQDLARFTGTPVQTDPNRRTLNPISTVGGKEAAASNAVVAAKEREVVASNAAAAADTRQAAASSAAAFGSVTGARSGLLGRGNDLFQRGAARVGDLRPSSLAQSIRRQMDVYTNSRGYGDSRTQSAINQARASWTSGMLTMQQAAGRAGDFARRGALGVRNFGSAIYNMIGPLGLAMGAAIGFQAVLDKISKTRQKEVDFADRLASTQGGGAEQNAKNIRDAQSKLNSDLIARANSGKLVDEAELVRSLHLSSSSGKAEAKAAYDYLYRESFRNEQKARNQALLEAGKTELVGKVSNLRIEDIIGKDGWVTDTMNQFRAGILDPKSMKQLLNEAEKQAGNSDNISKAERDRIKGTIQRLRSELIADVGDLAELREGGIGNADLATLQKVAASASGKAQLGQGGIRNWSTAITALRAQAASAATPPNGGAADYQKILESREQVRQMIQQAVTNGIEDDMTLARTEGERREVQAKQMSRLTQLASKSRAEAQKDISAADRRVKRDQKEIRDLRKTAEGDGKFSVDIDLFGEGGIELRDERREAAKRIQTLQKRVDRNKKQRDTLKAALDDEQKYFRVLERQLQLQEFDRRQQVQDAANQLSLARSNAGMPRLEMALQQAKQKLSEAIKANLPVERINQYRTEVENAAQAAVQEQMNQLTANGALAQAYATGDAKAQQQAQINSINEQLALMKANPQVYSQADITNKTAELISAQKQATDAIVEEAKSYIQALANLRKSRTEDPVEQARIDLNAALAIYREGNFKTKADKLNAQADVNNARTALRNQRVDSALSDIDYLAEMEKITTDQQIARLQKLLKVAGLSKERMRQIRLKIKQLQDEQKNGAEDGSFDLDVGNIKLPTYTEIRRAVVGRQRGMSIQNRNTVIVNVNQGGDVDGVARALEDNVSGVSRAQLRAAGMI